MSRAINQVNGYILHSRPFQESSLILQVFSQQSGRLSVLAKGVRGKRSQARRALLQPFQELQLTFVGLSDLKTLTHCEMVPQSMPSSHLLREQKLVCAYYANELITRALPESEEFNELYCGYRDFITSLQTSNELPPVLRRFEMTLLQAVGLAPDCLNDVEDNPIEAESHYSLAVESGFSKIYTSESSNGGVQEPQEKLNFSPDRVFSGRAILALAGQPLLIQDWQACQTICQKLLQEIIGDKPLQSRKLWHHSRFHQVNRNPLQETNE